MLLQGAQHAVCGNKAACLEQNTWTLSLKYALCETSFLLVSQTKLLPILSDLQKHQVSLLHVWEYCDWKGISLPRKGPGGLPLSPSPSSCVPSETPFLYWWLKEKWKTCQNANSSLQGREIKLEGGLAGVHSSACTQQPVVLGIGAVWCVSPPKNCLGGCHHRFTCTGSHGHPGCGSWWKQTFSLRNVGLSCASTLGCELSLYPWPQQRPWAVLQFVSSFLLLVLNMLLLIPLDYSFCITRSRDYLFPFLHLCHVLPCPHQLCLLPGCVIYWTCPWVDAFPFLGYIILYSSLNLFWILRRGWSKVVLCCEFLQKLQGEFQSVQIVKSPTLIFFVLSVTWCRAKINNHKKINFNYHVLELVLCICCFSDILSLWNQFMYIVSDRPTYVWNRASRWISLSQ